MGINKSGQSDPRMLTHGGFVTVSSEGLILNDNLSTQQLEHPPAVREETTTTDLVTTPKPLRRMYTTTRAARIKQSFIDGEGAIYAYGAGLTALATVTAINFYYWVVTLVHTLIANASVIIADVTVVALAIVGILWLLGGSRGGQTAVLKGCPKGPTPGAIKVRL